MKPIFFYSVFSAVMISTSLIAMHRVAPIKYTKSPRVSIEHTKRFSCTSAGAACACRKPYELLDDHRLLERANFSTIDAFERYQDAQQRLDKAITYQQQYAANSGVVAQLKEVQENLCPQVQTCMQPFIKMDKKNKMIVTAIAAIPPAYFELKALLTMDPLLFAFCVPFLSVTYVVLFCGLFRYSQAHPPMNHFLVRETRKIDHALAPLTIGMSTELNPKSASR